MSGWLRVVGRGFAILGILFFLIAGRGWAQEQPVEESRGSAPRARTLTAGWYLWDPYQYEEFRGDQRVLTGLDIRLLSEIASRAGYFVTFDYVEWSQHLRELRTGERQLAGGAFHTRERSDFVYFSDPYRTEINVLIMRRGETPLLNFDTPDQMLEEIENKGLRIGVVDGYAYALPEINAFLRRSDIQPRIMRATTLQENFHQLINTQIDVFFADRIVAQTVAWKEQFQHDVEEHPSFRAEAPIHMLFSKAAVRPEVVEEFNRALAEMRADGTHSRIMREYLFPILLNITVQTRWFLWLEIMGTIAFAISGLVIARREKYTLLAAVVLAALPAVGGGIMRDLIAGRAPVGIVRYPIHIVTVIATVFAGYLFLRIWARVAHLRAEATQLTDKIFGRVVQVADALGLAAFMVVGVVVAVETRCDPLWLWGPIMAVLTGAGGGILRDMLRSESQIPTLKGEFYPEVAFIWGLVLTGLLYLQTLRAEPLELMASVILCLVGAFTTRMVAMQLKWKSPMY